MVHKKACSIIFPGIYNVIAGNVEVSKGRERIEKQQKESQVPTGPGQHHHIHVHAVLLLFCSHEETDATSI